jgi:hypothetical protein
MLHSFVKAKISGMTFKDFLLVTSIACLAAPSFAADTDQPKEPDKITTLIVYGDDPCPRSSDEEIVVCAREPESERYRIPKRLRHVKPSAVGRSWGERAQVLEMVGRRGAPSSCSPIGSNGQSGCMAQFLRQAREEREQAELEGPQAP